MTPRPDLLAVFRSIPLFEDCTEEELHQIDAASDQITVGVGKELVRQGDLGREFVVVVSGTASVRRDGVEVATLGPGDHFGELALLVDHPRNASVVATTSIDIEVIDRRGFQSLLDSSPHLTRNLLASLARRLAEVDERD